MANSEKTVKEAIVKRYNREDFYLATKLPAWCMKDESDRIFNEQLERCGVDYFDFYLLHSIEDGSNGDTYERLPSKELLQYLQDKWFIDS